MPAFLKKGGRFYKLLKSGKKRRISCKEYNNKNRQTKKYKMNGGGSSNQGRRKHSQAAVDAWRKELQGHFNMRNEEARDGLEEGLAARREREEKLHNKGSDYDREAFRREMREALLRR